MALTANITTHDGIEITDSNIRVTQAYEKQMKGDWKQVDDV